MKYLSYSLILSFFLIGCREERVPFCFTYLNIYNLTDEFYMYEVYLAETGDSIQSGVSLPKEKDTGKWGWFGPENPGADYIWGGRRAE